jgi:hypothetical protein
LPAWLGIHIVYGSTQCAGFPFCSQRYYNNEDYDDGQHMCPTNESLHGISNDKGVRIVNVAT